MCRGLGFNQPATLVSARQVQDLEEQLPSPTPRETGQCFQQESGCQSVPDLPDNSTKQSPCSFYSADTQGSEGTELSLAAAS